MVSLAARLYPEMLAAERGSARSAPWMAPAAPWTAPTLFLVREALPHDAGYRVAVGEGEEEGPPSTAPAASVGTAPVPVSEADALDALEEEIVVLSAHIHAATHRLLTLIAQFDRRRGWEMAGHRTCAHWLAFRTGLDLGAAREKVRAARALEWLPETSASMARGELSFSQVRALSRVATPANERDLLELARGCTTAQLERMVRAVRRGSEADEAEAERRRYQARTLSVFPDDDGMYLVRGRLTAEEGALLMRAIEAAGDALYREERWPPEVVKAAAAQGHVLETETEREAAQRRADALGLVAERALAAGFGGRRNREGAGSETEGPEEEQSGDAPEGLAGAVPAGGLPVPISGSRAERYQVVLHVEAETLRRAPEPNPGEPGETSERGAPRVSAEPPGGAGLMHPTLQVPRSELDDGTRVSPATSRRLSCDASVVRLTKAPDGSILDVGRRTRTIPPALRRALEARDRGCRFPGCGSRFTDAHHVIPWADGGDTSLGNCVLLCKYHHRLVHEGGWTVDWWGEGRPVFSNPRGGVHCEGRWEAPKLEGELAEALVKENRQRGLRPDAWALGARWKREEDIPDTVYFSAMEALS